MLHRLPGREGCLARLPSRACGTGRGLETPASVAISRDGRVVAIAARNGQTIGVYRRSASGALTAAGCFQTRATGGCREAPGLRQVSGLAFAPNGRVLVAATGAGLVSFRNGAGRLSFAQVAPTRGAVALAFTPDSGYVYAVGGGGTHGWLDVVELGSNGGMNRIQCVEPGEVAPCQAATGLEQPAGVAVSPDDRYVYVASAVSGAVATFERTKVGAVGTPRVVKNPAFARATGIAASGARVYVSAAELVTQLPAISTSPGAASRSSGYPDPRSRAHSSAGERPLHTREVPGSIPGAPTHPTKSGRRFRVAHGQPHADREECDDVGQEEDADADPPK